jgi:hypothetical protein
MVNGILHVPSCGINVPLPIELPGGRGYDAYVQALSPILKRLQELDRTQGWLARKLGVDPSTVNRWVKGTAPILPHRQRELALALGVRVEDICPEPVAA